MKGFILSYLGRSILLLITCSLVISVLLIFVFVGREAIPFLTKVGLVKFLASTARYPEAYEDPEFGALAMIAGSAYVTAAALLFSVPVGILAAVFLSDIVPFKIRAVGETMVVWMASGNASQIPHPWWDLSQSVRTLTATIAGDMGETAQGSDHYQALFALGFLLLVLTFFLNGLSEYFLSSAKKASGKSK